MGDLCYILDDDEEPDYLCGITEVDVSIEQLEALKKGKRLYLTVEWQEYAVVIKLKNRDLRMSILE